MKRLIIILLILFINQLIFSQQITKNTCVTLSNAIIYSDAVTGVIVRGDPITGKYRKIIQKLMFPTALVTDQMGTMLFVLEYARNQIKKVNLNEKIYNNHTDPWFNSHIL